jgi:lipid-A-disaccharide synthase
MNQRPSFFIIAGETSGDILGGRLMSALKQRTNARFSGIGGISMESEGLQSLFPMSELTLMGIFEVLPQIPNLIKRINQTAEVIKKYKPDVVITIDSPDFCFRVAKKIKKHGIPIVHYVAPSVWVWRSGRAKKCARILDHILALLPMEPPYFTKHGLAATFVGHPVLESGAGKGDGETFRNSYAIKSDEPVLCILPGSRTSEINHLVDIFEKTYSLLKNDHPTLRCLIPSLPKFHDTLHKVFPDAIIVPQNEKYDAMAASTVALAASGTVSLELAMAKVPTVIGYRFNGLSTFFANIVVPFTKFKYASIINILLDEEVTPEYIFYKCTPQNLAQALNKLLDSKKLQARQIAKYSQGLELLRSNNMLPSAKAADTILSLITNTIDPEINSGLR